MIRLDPFTKTRRSIAQSAGQKWWSRRRDEASSLGLVLTPIHPLGVTFWERHGPTGMGPNYVRRARTGVTLVELLCVMTIIAILASLMLPGLARGLRKARGLGEHLGSGGGIQMRIEEVATNYTRYRQAHPNHPKLSRKEFVAQLNLSPAAETWLNLKSVDYRPFAATNSLEESAIVVYPSEGSGSGEKTIVFAIRDLLAH